MIIAIAQLVAGFLFLIKGADFLVDGSSSIAKRYKVSNLVIGLTIVAFGTSAPELIVNVVSSMQGQNGLAIGNILGSNISNVLLVLGITAMIHPLEVKKNTVFKEMPLNLLATLAVFVLANDLLIDKVGFSLLSRADGIILLFFFAIFLYYTFSIAKEERDVRDGIDIYSLKKSSIFVLLGIAGLSFGGDWVISGATSIAKSFGISELITGLTILAVGTSLPELVTSIVAATKKNVDIAVGNIVGSNIFNLLWIFGVSSIISPIEFSLESNVDLLIVIGTSLLLFWALFSGKSRVIEKFEGTLFVMLYVAYIFSLFLRG